MERREFLTGSVFAATAGLALDACAPPSTELIPILIPEEPFVPGQETWINSTCFDCAAACGIAVRRIDGRLVKVEGNPDHPVSRGGVCARGQALPQAMYHPDRIKTPLEKRDDGTWRAIDWEQALERIAAALDDGPSIAFGTGETTGHRRAIVERFLQAFGSGERLVHEALPSPATHPPIENASYVVSFGAELLEGVSPVRYARGLTELRHGRPGRRGKFVMVGPRLSLTAANADEWFPARPGEELDLALGVAHVLIQDALASDADIANIEGFERLRDVAAAAPTTPAVERLAHELAEHRPAVAIAARGDQLELAVSLVNRLLGTRETQTPEPPFTPWPALDAEPARTRLLNDVVGRPDPSRPDVLFVADTNPLYSVSPSLGVPDWLDAIPLRVSFASILDETAALCHLILPESAVFERFEDAVPPGSPVATASLSQPILSRPLYDTRSMPDSLIAIAKAAGKESAFPWDSYEAALEDAWAGLGISWDEARAQGGWWDRDPETPASPDSLDAAPLDDWAPRPETALELHVYASTPFGDGRSASLPFLQELSDPITGARWGSVLEIATDVGDRLGIQSGDVVEVTSDAGTLRVAALVTPGIHPGVVALAAGQGHTSGGRYATGRGANAFALGGGDRTQPTAVRLRKVSA